MRDTTNASVTSRRGDVPTDVGAGSDDVDRRSDSSDGRVRRRNRNMAAVRAAIVHLLGTGETLSIPIVARLAGIAGRSVYRYYGDLQGAVHDAVVSRLDEVTAGLPDLADIDPTLPLDQRVENITRRRVEMWWQLAAVLNHLPDAERDAAMARFDEVTTRTFAPELAAFDDPDRGYAESALAIALRMRSIDDLAGRYGHDPIDTAKALRFSIFRILEV